MLAPYRFGNVLNGTSHIHIPRNMWKTHYLPCNLVHTARRTNTTPNYTVTHHTQSGQMYVTTGQFFPSRILPTLAQNNTPYSNKTNPTHPLTTESSPPYTKRIVGLSTYTNLPSTPALQHKTYTHIDKIPANHTTHDTTPSPSETNDNSSETRKYEKTKVISLIPSFHKRHHLRGRRAHQLPPH
jgi:hypothetical protein